MLETMIKNMIDTVHKTQGVKRDRVQIEVTVPMKTPTGEIINVPVKKVKSYKALGIRLEEV